MKITTPQLCFVALLSVFGLLTWAVLDFALFHRVQTEQLLDGALIYSLYAAASLASWEILSSMLFINKSRGNHSKISLIFSTFMLLFYLYQLDSIKRLYSGGELMPVLGLLIVAVIFFYSLKNLFSKDKS